jgi:hypothetical protein
LVGFGAAYTLPPPFSPAPKLPVIDKTRIITNRRRRIPQIMIARVSPYPIPCQYYCSPYLPDVNPRVDPLFLFFGAKRTAAAIPPPRRRAIIRIVIIAQKAVNSIVYYTFPK